MGDTSGVPSKLVTLDNAPKNSNAALTAEVESEQNSNTSLRRSGRQVLRSIKYTALLGWDFTC